MWLQTKDQLPQENQDVFFIPNYGENKILIGVFTKRPHKDTNFLGTFTDKNGNGYNYWKVATRQEVLFWQPVIYPNAPNIIFIQ